MKNKYLIFSVLFLAFFSCTEKILNEIDSNPNQVNEAPLKSVLPQVEVSYAFEVAGGRSAVYAGFMSELTTYVLGSNPYYELSFGASTAWENGYLLLNDLKRLKEKSIEKDAWSYAGICDVIKAFTLSNLVDLFGDIPYSKALDPNVRNPEFDKAKVVYDEIFIVLDEAITNLQKSSAINPTNDDLYFNGDVQLWIKTAYGLKARLYNRLSNVDPSGSAQKSLADLAKSFSNKNEGFGFKKYATNTTNGNPFSVSQSVQPQSAVGNGIFNTMLLYCPTGKIEEDPRANIWFTTVKGKRIPAPNGKAQSDFGDPRLDGAIYSKPQTLKFLNAYQPLLTYAELLFIKAEANYRLGKKNDALLAYKEAIQLAMEEASKFNPSVALTSVEINGYLANPKVLPSEANLSQELILQQKYIYFFQYQPIEGYNEIRRNNITTPTNPLGRPNQFVYPNEEISRNSNTPSNVDIYSIFDNSTKLFWAK